jgi:peptidoglycan hydrolase CwlO-like protein
MKNNIFKLNLFLLLSSVLFLPSFVFSEDLESICQLDKIESECNNLEAEQCRQLLEKCESYYNQLSEDIGEDLSKTEAEKKTLENKVSSLQKKIKNLDYQIYQSNLIIKDIGIQIVDTEGSIDNTGLKIEDSKEKLANIIRSIYEEDQKSIVEILVSDSSISGFFDNLAALECLNSESKDLLQNIKILKISLEDQKQSLDSEKQDLENIVEIQTVQKQQSAISKQEQEYYLKLTEQEYQKYLAEKQNVDQKASEIRIRIFELAGGGAEPPTFGEAYEIAKEVESITGVRPAFLLAILTQESNLGKNVGQCYLKNSSTGAGEVIKTGKVLSKVMSPTRDVNPFLTITKELGRDPYMTPVSCPMSYGWGGAMGPAQFIPSTWMIYRDELREIKGKPGDPWNIKDAFLASALYLADYGAAKQTYEGEFNAALSYFAGPGWYKSSYKKVYERDYGYPVMAITKAYETDIAKIK